MDVTSLYTNIRQEEGVETVCKTYESFYKASPATPTRYFERAFKLILQENSLEFTEKKGKEKKKKSTRGSATKIVFAFGNVQVTMHRTILYTAITFFVTNVFKGKRYAIKSLLDVETHLKAIETISSENEFKTKISHFRASYQTSTPREFDYGYTLKHKD